MCAVMTKRNTAIVPLQYTSRIVPHAKLLILKGVPRWHGVRYLRWHDPTCASWPFDRHRDSGYAVPYAYIMLAEIAISFASKRIAIWGYLVAMLRWRGRCRRPIPLPISKTPPNARRCLRGILRIAKMPYILHAKRDTIADWFESQEVLDLAIDGHDETHFLAAYIRIGLR
jgi:hypothetical protein